ncbi:MAG: S49 family peptidase [Alphaproteobacteria bacterium]|nr:S49 family peptidase [Alphaproteobacteria bacterium]
MPSWREIVGEILEEIKNITTDGVNDEGKFNISCWKARRKYIEKFHKHTGRNVLAYYSGWLQKTDVKFRDRTSISDIDIHALMACFYGMDFNKGLDLILHSPGGDVAATESIIHYLREKFDDNIRVFVPQISMSGGTMLALSGYEIWMGAHSNLGPIDPQMPYSAKLILEEFEKAKKEILKNPAMLNVWRPILERISPTVLTNCQKAIEWSKQIAENTLQTGSMFQNKNDIETKIIKIVDRLLDHDKNKDHGRHIQRDECKEMGLIIKDLETDQALQDIILSIHHAFIFSVSNTKTVKISQSNKDQYTLLNNE